MIIMNTILDMNQQDFCNFVDNYLDPISRQMIEGIIGCYAMHYKVKDVSLDDLLSERMQTYIEKTFDPMTAFTIDHLLDDLIKHYIEVDI